MAKKTSRNQETTNKKEVQDLASSRDFEQTAREAEKEQTKKPGSQSNRASKRNNNGRGGGK